MRRALTIIAASLVLASPGGAAVVPNDPAWPDQWALRTVGLPDVWEATTGDPSVVIGIVDTGVAPIPDLEGALLTGYDFIDNDRDARDTNSHGTRVAAVIAGRGNDRRGLAGHCWRCSILPVRISSGGSATPALIATGIRYAVDNGARIVNVSLAHAGYDAAEDDAVRYAAERGAIVVASAGNTGGEAPQYPAALPGVVAVGATDDKDSLYFWSSRGPWVALTAPGCHLVADATFPMGTLCGTSFTPSAVSGILGLLWSKNPGLTRDQLLNAVFASARRVQGAVHGRIDAAAAFRLLGLMTPAAPAPSAQPAQAPTPPTSVARPRTVAVARYTRQRVFETGTFKRGFRTTFAVGRGRFELHLQTPNVAACSLTLSSPQEFIVAARLVRNLMSISLSVPAGRYTAAVRCRGDRTRQYSLGVIGMFPRLP
jgi:subtilisin family serine protease